MALPKDEAWFPRKTYGYGWGFPRRWQGWVVMVVYCAALAGGGVFVRTRPAYFLAGAVILSIALVAVCAWKGESPRWQWGGERESPAPREKAAPRSPR